MRPTDPNLTCDKAEIAVSRLPEWTGRRLCKWLNMAYNSSHVAWGKTNRKHRVDVDFARLIQMCRFDCAKSVQSVHTGIDVSFPCCPVASALIMHMKVPHAM